MVLNLDILVPGSGGSGTLRPGSGELCYGPTVLLRDAHSTDTAFDQDGFVPFDHSQHPEEEVPVYPKLRRATLQAQPTTPFL